MSPTNCALVRDRQIESQETQHRGYKPLSGSQTQAVDALDDHRAVNSRIRIDPGCTRPKASLGVSPSSQCGFVDPEGNSAPSNEGLIIMVPVTNTVSEGVCVVCHEPLSRHPTSLANCATTPLLPLLDLIRMDIELLVHLRRRPRTAAKATFALESR